MYREANSCADRLARMGAELTSNHLFWCNPPPMVVDLLSMDKAGHECNRLIVPLFNIMCCLTIYIYIYIYIFLRVTEFPFRIVILFEIMVHIQHLIQVQITHRKRERLNSKLQLSTDEMVDTKQSTTLAWQKIS